ncbi:MAG: Gfo/Idh/MocA family oxidoreductase [Abitibacteriaceae bacterium]|nr:Gfo/Idh/MocA family oxidoreductase [Abditibacteriaceae bacterium]
MAETDKTIRIGMIGTGQIGKSHLSRYEKIPGAEIVALADINEAEVKRVAEQYKVPHVYTDFRELLKRDDIDAVDVCLHNNFHRPMTVVALEAGKHVYCEKPMAGTYRDAQIMYETAQKTGRKLSIQLATLFEKETRVAKTLIDEGRLGQLYHARSTGFRRRGRPYVDGYGTPTFVQKRNSGGGALYDMGVYHIARMLYLLGNPAIERITGKTYQKTAIDAEREKTSGYDVEELGLGFVRLSNDITLDLIEAWAIHLDRFDGSVLVGSEGGIRLDPFGFFTNIGDLEVNSTVDLDRASYRWHNVRGVGDVYNSAQNHWIAALQGRVELLPTAEVALNTALISEGIYLSNELKREVTADEVRELSKSIGN